MAASPPQAFDVVVIGAGPVGVVAALRAARLGASTALVARDQFGGVAANDGPVPVRTLAQAARLIREARQLPLYGIAGCEPSLDYPRLLARVRGVTADARQHTLLRDDLERAGVGIYEQAGTARFADAHTVESDNAPPLHAGKVILCTGGASRPLAVPGFDLTATYSDAWHLSSVPLSLLVIGAGATGVQVASIFNAFGSRVHLVEIAPRILMTEDQEVSETVTAAMVASGVQVVEDAGTIDRFERCATGVRLTHPASDGQHGIDVALAVVAARATAGLALDRAGVQTGRRGYVQVDAHLRAARLRRQRYQRPRAGRARGGPRSAGGRDQRRPRAHHGAAASGEPDRQLHRSRVRFGRADRGGRPGEPRGGRGDGTVRLAPAADHRWPPDGVLQAGHRPRASYHPGLPRRGERAVELVQLAATAMAAKMPVQELALVPFSFPTYANALGRAAVLAAIELDRTGMWAVDHLETAVESGVA